MYVCQHMGYNVPCVTSDFPIFSTLPNYDTDMIKKQTESWKQTLVNGWVL